MRTLVVASVLACGLFGAYAVRGESEQSKGPTKGEVLHSPGGGYCIYGDGLWTRSIWVEYGSFNVKVISTELGPNAAHFSESIQEYSTSYQPEIVAGRSADDFVIGGFAHNDDVVVERWVYQAPKGAYFTYIVENPSPIPPIGTPTPITEPQTYISGGDWLEPSLRGAVVPPRRLEIYRGDGIGSVDGVTFDGEGRYAIVHSAEDKAIYRLNARAANAQPAVIADETTVPILAEAAHIEDRKTGSGKRLILVWDDEHFANVSIIWDDDNDGNFDNIEHVARDVFDAMYLGGFGAY